MDSRLLVLLAIVSVAAPALAQERAQGLVRPITAPVKYAGVYHLGTGTWTRAGLIGGGGSAPTAGTGPGIIYDNTCYLGYYMSMATGTIDIDEGRLPSTSSPVLPNPWGLGHDSEVGTQDTYTVDGFQIAYCTSEDTARAYSVRFFEAYDSCSPSPATATAAFLLSGLPASPAAGVQACWKVDIDLCASSQSFSMQADADQTYDGLAMGVHDTFGWSIELLSAAPHAQDGVMPAGYSVWFQHCSSSDGTVFDSGTSSAIYPANSDSINLGCGSLAAGSAAEEGLGMGAQDRFRMENYPGLNDGCYWFQNGWGSFHLQLYSADVVLPNVGSIVPYCDPSPVGGAAFCPCSNPPPGSGRGCNNSAATGGASLTATGSPSLAADTLGFTTAGELATSLTILVQGTNSDVWGVPFGQGVRCATGMLKRLYSRAASSGSITVPGPGDPHVSTRSAALGDPIASGSQRYYFAMYRDPVVLGGCPASRTFNCTNANAVLWN